MFRLYLYARVRISMHTLHTRPRVQRAPGIPCTLRFRGGDKFMQTSGAMRCENAKRYLVVIVRLVRNCALGRTIQYSRDASDGIDKPRRTGSPAFAGDDDLSCRDSFASLAMTWRVLNFNQPNVHTLAAPCPSCATTFSPKIERAQGMPGAG